MRILSVAALSWALLASGCAQTQKDPKAATNDPTQSEKNADVPTKKATPTAYNVQDLDTAAPEIEAALAKAQNGDIQSAIQELQQTTQKNPKAFLGFYNLGLLYERQLDPTQARIAYQKALDAEPKFYPALIQLARTYIKEQQPLQAIQWANQAIAKSPDTLELNYAKLEALIADRQLEDAIALARRLLKQDEASAKLRYYLAAAEFQKKRHRLAEFEVNESLEIDPNDDEALFLLARIHDALSQEDIALIPGIAATLDRVLALNPDHIEALWMRGVIYYEASNYAEAEKNFRRMIELNPSIPGAYINLANTLKTTTRGPEAEQLLQKAKQIDPKNGLVEFSLGTLYLDIERIPLPGQMDMDRLKRAKTHFENAQSYWTSEEDTELAKAYIRTTNDAIETLQAMLDAEALFGPAQTNDTEPDAPSDESQTQSSPSYRVE